MNKPLADLYQETIAAMQRADMARAHALALSLCESVPEDFDAHQLAAVSALELGRADAALHYFSQAVRVARLPAFSAAAWTGIGEAHLLKESPPKRADAAFRRALGIVHEFPPALAGLAEALARQGRHDEAEGRALRARELGVQTARLETTLGQSLIGQGRFDEALEAFQRASALEPQAQEPRAGIAAIAKIRGDFTTAEGIYREIIAAAPLYPVYGQLADLKKFSPADPDLAMMEERLATLPAEAPVSMRAELHFAVAKAYDDLDDMTRASEHLRRANTLEQQRSEFDADEDEARMERIKQLFTREFISRFEAAGLRDLRPIFVVSLPRAGSTLTEQMLASHTQIRGGGELGHFSRIATELSLHWGAQRDFPELDLAAAGEDLRIAAQEYARQTASLRLLQPYFTDKSLNNFLYLGLIRMMLPDARVIHVRRHPLASALGLYRQRFARGIGYSYDLELIARHYRAYSALMSHWREVVPGTFVELHYEALVDNPEFELRKLFGYLGLEFEPACLEYYRLQRPVRTASLTQVRQPLERSGIDRHERYSELLRPVAARLRDEIAAYEEGLGAALAAQQHNA